MSDGEYKDSYYGVGYDDGQTVSSSRLPYVIEAMLDYWWLSACVFLIILSSSIIYVFSKPKLYTATAQLQLYRDDPAVLNHGAELEPNRIQSAEDLNTQLAVLESTQISSRVARRLSRPEIRELVESNGALDDVLLEKVAGEIHAMISVKPRRMSLVVLISASHPNRKLSATVANLYAQECIEMNLETNVSGSRDAFNELVALRDQERKVITQLESDLAHYREERNMVSIDRKEDIIRDQLIALNEERVSAQSTHDRAKLKWNTVEQYIEEKKDLVSLPFFKLDQEIRQHSGSISELSIELATQSQRYRAKHPTITELNARLHGHKEGLNIAKSELIESIHATYILAKEEFNQANARLSEKKQELINLSKLRIEYDSMSRELEVKQAFLGALNTRMVEERAQVDLKKKNARIIQAAAVPTRVSSPNLKIGLLAGLLASLVGGVAVAGLATFLDGRVKSIGALERIFNAQSLGIVPRVDKLSAEFYTRLNQADYHSGTLEVFHSIRSGMQIKSGIKDPKVMLVSSTMPGEGKSFVALNLAEIYARHSERTLLIDCDLRMPVIAKRLSLKQKVGLSEYVESDEMTALDDIIQKIYPNLDVITAGEQRRGDPSTLFSDAQFKSLIAAMRGKYDRIIIDSPPLSVVSDALNLLPLSDGLLYVVKHNYVSHVMLNSTVKTLQASNLPITGFVLNGISPKLMKLYNYKYAYTSVSDAYGAKVCEAT